MYFVFTNIIAFLSIIIIQTKSVGSFSIKKNIYLSHKGISDKTLFCLNDKINDDNKIDIPLKSVETERKPIGAVPEFALPSDSVEETSFQKIAVYSHFLITFALLSNSFSSFPINSLLDVTSLISVIILSIVIGDFGTGVFHWSVDNYGSIKTPVFGSVCAAFQGHHQTPWTITFRSFVNNVYKIAFGTIPALLIVALLNFGSLNTIFFTLFINWWMISQELHKYSHMKKIPSVINFLQNNKIILSRKEHGQHHNSPFEGHYCILTGVCNEVLDRTLFFRKLEKFVFLLTGNKPITWKEDSKLEQLSMSLKISPF